MKIKQWHCKVCGTLQDPSRKMCIDCGSDLGLYGEIVMVDAPDPHIDDDEKEDEEKISSEEIIEPRHFSDDDDENDEIRRRRRVRRTIVLISVMTVMLLLSAAAFTVAYRYSKKQYPTDGLIAYFSFDDAKTGLSGAGAVAAPLNYDGDADPRFVSDAIRGRAIEFTGNDPCYWLEVKKQDGSPLLSGADSFTVSYWSKNDAGDKPKWMFFASPVGWNSEDCPGGEQYVGILENKQILPEYFNIAYSDGLRVYTPEIYKDIYMANPIDEWKHVAFSYDSDTKTLRYYWNGSIIGEIAVSHDNHELRDILSDDSVVYIGYAPWLNDSGGEYCMGYIDEYRIYNRALTNEEVVTLANGDHKADDPPRYEGDIIPDSVKTYGHNAPDATSVYLPVDPENVIHDGKGTWNNNINNIAVMAFDMNSGTFYDCDEYCEFKNTDEENVGMYDFDRWDGDKTKTGYVGAYFEGGVYLTQIRWFGRIDFPDRNAGGYFEASADGKTWTTIYTIGESSDCRNYELADIPEKFRSKAYTYIRYVGPTDGYCNICEIEFWGNYAVSSAN